MYVMWMQPSAKDLWQILTLGTTATLCSIWNAGLFGSREVRRQRVAGHGGWCDWQRPWKHQLYSLLQATSMEDAQPQDKPSQNVPAAQLRKQSLMRWKASHTVWGFHEFFTKGDAMCFYDNAACYWLATFLRPMDEWKWANGHGARDQTGSPWMLPQRLVTQRGDSNSTSCYLLL